MSGPILSKVEYVPIQTIWKDEDRDLTPWIASEVGLETIAEVLGFRPVEPRTQVTLGSFRADIVAKREDTEDTVVFENQFGDTDHRHLGQSITYAASLEAAVVIWVAERFTEEHKQALRWLNENGKGLSLIGVELKVVKIGGGPPAPLPVVVVSPSEEAASTTDALKPWLTRGREWHLKGDVWQENAKLIGYLGEKLEAAKFTVNWNLKLYIRAKGTSNRDVVLYDGEKKGRIDVCFSSGTPAEVEALLSGLSINMPVVPEHQYAGDPWVSVESTQAIDVLYPAITKWLSQGHEPPIP